MPKKFFHSWGAWVYDSKTCTSSRTCTKEHCNYCREIKEAHDFNDWQFIQSDSCDQYRKCKNCQKAESRTVEHRFGDWKYHTGTCCEMRRVCKHCGQPEFRMQHEIKEVVSKENGCLVESRCVRCGEIISVREEHQWSQQELPYTDCLSHAIDFLDAKMQALSENGSIFGIDPLETKNAERTAEYLSLPGRQQKYKDMLRTASVDDLGVFCTRCKKPLYLGKKELRCNRVKGFLSYAWKDTAYADKIDEALRESEIYITRDIRDLDIGTNLQEFMNRVEESTYVVVIISDAYLRSPNCMYEAVKIVSALIRRQCLLLPIAVNQELADKEVLETYEKYWLEKLEAEKQNNGSAQSVVIYRDILDALREFLSMVIERKYEKVTGLEHLDSALLQRIAGKIKDIK